MSNSAEERGLSPTVGVLPSPAIVAPPKRRFAPTDEVGLRGMPRGIGRSYLRQALATGLPLLVADCVAVCGSVLLASLAISWLLPESSYLTLSLARQLVATVGLTVMIFSAFGLYPGTGLNAIFEFRHSVTAVVLIFVSLLLGNAFFGRLLPYEAWLFGGAFVVASFMVPVFRGMVRSFCSRFPWWGQPLLVIGNGESAFAMYDALRRHPNTGLRPAGIVGDIGRHWSEETSQPHLFLGDLSELTSLTAKHRAHWAVVTGSTLSDESIDTTEIGIPHLLVVPELQGLPSLWNQTQCHAGQAAIHVQERLLLPIPQLLKRAMDLALIALGGLILLPVICLIAVAIKSSSPGPIFYRQRRIGKNGQVFGMWKFRSMVRNADAVLDVYLNAHPELRQEWERDHKLRSDPRVTWVGRFLRKTSLDELPQLWNVIRGEMSLVGPRPIVDGEEGRPYVDDHPSSYRRYTRVTPGITGLWQVSGRNDTTYTERVNLDTYYVRNWSPWLDAYILARTARVVLLGEGAY